MSGTAAAGPGSSLLDAAARLAAREISAAELLETHLARIDEVDGERSFDGSPETINAWVRVYEERARADAARADARLAADAVRRDGPAPVLCGIPIGLKDLYAAAGHPRTASCRVVDDAPEREDATAWARLSAEGMVLLGHLHTHECAAGGSTDQTGNPWDLTRTPGGSSGGSAAALAAGMVMAATGTDTAGSLRIPSALCATSTIKPTRGAVPLHGVFPLSVTLDHPGPMARSVADCRPLLAAMMGVAAPERPAGGGTLEGVRLLASPRVPLVALDPDVGALYEQTLRTCERLGAVVVDDGPPGLDLDPGTTFLDVLSADMLAFHHRYDARRADYRQSVRDLLEYAEKRALPAEEYTAAQAHRIALADGWAAFLRAERIDAVIEPTVPLTAPVRGTGYDAFFTADGVAYIALTHYWDWTGFPVVALPAGLGPATGLPVGVSLAGAPGDEWRLLDLGEALQDELGLPVAPMRS